MWKLEHTWLIILHMPSCKQASMHREKHTHRERETLTHTHTHIHEAERGDNKKHVLTACTWNKLYSAFIFNLVFLLFSQTQFHNTTLFITSSSCSYITFHTSDDKYRSATNIYETLFAFLFHNFLHSQWTDCMYCNKNQQHKFCFQLG